MARVADYTFDDSTGDGVTSDSSGNGYDASVQNGAASTGNGSMRFDGVDDHVVLTPRPETGIDQGTIRIDFTRTAPSNGDTP